MSKLLKLKNSSAGTAAIEFAILLPFLLIVLYGVYQVTTYITAVRKIDNVTNDIGYILSREGCITPLDSFGNCTSSGGQAELQSVLDNTTPFLIYPYKYNNTDGSSQIKVKFVGLPIFTGCTPPNCPDQVTARVMWEHRSPASPGTLGATTTGDDTVTIAACDTGPNAGSCPKNPADQFYNSLYSEGGLSRADIIYPGQSFVLVNFAFNFKELLGNNIVGFVLPTNIEKLSSYATRSRLTNVVNPSTNVLEAKALNNMQFCTDCNIFTSQSAITGTGGTPMQPSGTEFRQVCALPAPTSTSMNNDSAGCSFY